MDIVASSEDVGIYCSRDHRISFFNSPYLAHHCYTALDLYPKRGFGEAAPSPVKGVVTKVRQVKCPKGKYFESSGFDYAILMKSLENPERLVKVLHVIPTVKIGELVEPGQDLGFLLRSGYFNFWTEPHIHVEVRNFSDPIRARGGFKIKRITRIDEADPVKDLKGTAIEVRPEYSLISLEGASAQGLPAEIGANIGVLDAGLPHYGWVGIHTNDVLAVGEPTKLCGKKLGTIELAHQNMGLARCANLSFRLGKHPVGLSLYLQLCSEALIKIIPQKPGTLRINRFEEVSIDIV